VLIEIRTVASKADHAPQSTEDMPWFVIFPLLWRRSFLSPPVWFPTMHWRDAAEAAAAAVVAFMVAASVEAAPMLGAFMEVEDAATTLRDVRTQVAQ
jgi:hypothetical protein